MITVTDHTYIPAAPEYMRPYAEIVANNTAGRNLVAGQHLTASAADASLTLTALGHAGLDFTLGSGTVAYNWYLSGPEGLTFLQTGQNLDWVVDLSKIAGARACPRLRPWCFRSPICSAPIPRRTRAAIRCRSMSCLRSTCPW